MLRDKNMGYGKTKFLIFAYMSIISSMNET